MDPLRPRPLLGVAPLSGYLMSLASSQPNSPSPRVGSAPARAHPFSQPRSSLTGQPPPVRSSGFPNPVSTTYSGSAPRPGLAQRALTAAQPPAPRLLFL